MEYDGFAETENQDNENNPEQVFADSYYDALPTPRSAIDDIRAFEQVMRKPLTFEEQGLLAIRYRVCTLSRFDVVGLFG